MDSCGGARVVVAVGGSIRVPRELVSRPNEMDSCGGAWGRGGDEVVGYVGVLLGACTAPPTLPHRALRLCVEAHSLRQAGSAWRHVTSAQPRPI